MLLVVVLRSDRVVLSEHERADLFFLLAQGLLSTLGLFGGSETAFVAGSTSNPSNRLASAIGLASEVVTKGALFGIPEPLAI